jgi:hypothetical protein
MAVGNDDRIWSLHGNLSILTATDDVGTDVSYDISASGLDWTDMDVTHDGRVSLSQSNGTVYELDVATGSLSPTGYSQTLAANTDLTNIGFAGDVLYMATANSLEPRSTPTGSTCPPTPNFVTSPFPIIAAICSDQRRPRRSLPRSLRQQRRRMDRALVQYLQPRCHSWTRRFAVGPWR